jgi:hypothetical protein
MVEKTLDVSRYMRNKMKIDSECGSDAGDRKVRLTDLLACAAEETSNSAIRRKQARKRSLTMNAEGQ